VIEEIFVRESLLFTEKCFIEARIFSGSVQASTFRVLAQLLSGANKVAYGHPSLNIINVKFTALPTRSYTQYQIPKLLLRL
jgi:hypothetical protein